MEQKSVNITSDIIDSFFDDNNSLNIADSEISNIQKNIIVEDKTLFLITVTKNGYIKKTPLSEYNIQSRGGHGSLTHKITKKTGELIDTIIISSTNTKNIVIFTNESEIIIPINEVKTTERVAVGQKIESIGNNEVIKVIACQV